jgi:glutamate-1-semialdehyde 2,1-aminomutase/spore coat polysaccharide biosynthesis protein SpsF
MRQDLRVVAIIQARTGSSRLPGKVFAAIREHPMLWHVVNRVQQAALVNQVVMATSTEPGDDAIETFCQEHGFQCFRGSETDVLARFYGAAVGARADVVVRVTADCPLIDPAVINRTVEAFLEQGCDYLNNCPDGGYPDGMDAEVFSFKALEKAHRSATLNSDREHVTPYIRNSGNFRIGAVQADKSVPGMLRHVRLSVDRAPDLEFVRQIFDRANGNQFFGVAHIAELLQQEPQLMAINAGTIVNEGYYRSLAAEPPLPPKPRSLARSQELKRKAEILIPSCSQTFSKCPTQFVQGVAPVFLRKGAGSHVWDVDGNEYMDNAMALGPVILGYNYPRVTEAMVQQLQEGQVFSLPHPIEVELTELLTEIIPCAEMVRFGKNGSDATSGAVRVARAYTGRDLIACCGYHGWQDWYIGTTTRRLGVPRAVQQLSLTFEYNNIASLEQLFAEHPGKIAAVIMEPVGVVEPREEFLQNVRKIARREGAVLIFDEVVTGFRLSLGGAQEYFGVIPDLACFGKAMSNGAPVSAVVGVRDVMKVFDDVFFSFTYGGEAVSLAAAKATIAEIREKPVIDALWAQGQRLKDGYNTLAAEFGLQSRTSCIGLAPRTVATFRDELGGDSLLLKSLFQQECIKRGVLFTGGHNICYSHSSADIDFTLRVYRAAMEIIAEAIGAGDVLNRLEGTPLQPVFRRA